MKLFIISIIAILFAGCLSTREYRISTGNVIQDFYTPYYHIDQPSTYVRVINANRYSKEVSKDDNFDYMSPLQNQGIVIDNDDSFRSQFEYQYSFNRICNKFSNFRLIGKSFFINFGKLDEGMLITFAKQIGSTVVVYDEIYHVNSYPSAPQNEYHYTIHFYAP